MKEVFEMQEGTIKWNCQKRLNGTVNQIILYEKYLIIVEETQKCHCVILIGDEKQMYYPWSEDFWKCRILQTEVTSKGIYFLTEPVLEQQEMCRKKEIKCLPYDEEEGKFEKMVTGATYYLDENVEMNYWEGALYTFTSKAPEQCKIEAIGKKGEKIARITISPRQDYFMRSINGKCCFLVYEKDKKENVQIYDSNLQQIEVY